ncbi:M28 family peptidase [Flammeovirgaceae bacterium SG7u.111]|nr:M28 family peptidase [Flammeovirgaceae bacterium SG7u.132]WPO35360.1 M28 family peptidase [Flammeovirgaceae bacterium SG7u.111]
MRKLFINLFLTCCLVYSASAQEVKKYAETIKASDLKKHLEIIASDEYEGRETGEKGQKMAAEYIVNQFKGDSLIGPVKANTDNPYLQPFELEKSSWDDVTIETEGKKLSLFNEFFVYGNTVLENGEYEVIFGGYGIDTEKYSDYKDLDVEGKIVAVMEGEPKTKDIFLISGSEEKSPQNDTRAKIATASEKGAKGIIIVYESDENYQKRAQVFKQYASRPSLGFPKGKQDEGTALFFTSPTYAGDLLGTSPKKLQSAIKKINKKGKTLAGEYSNTIAITMERKIESVTTENVLGFLEGTDLKDEVVIVTAHYDHIGITGGEINNGADDDGSGTVSVLEIAEAFTSAKKEGHGPRRSMLFMTVTGEEKGLLGSRYYSENPIFPIENTVTDLNIDMVGRVDEKHKDNPFYIYIIGSDMLSSELHELSEDVAKKQYPNIELDYQYNAKDDPNRFYYRSDHYNFAKHGIPVIFYFNGTHEDYHRPTDTVEKIHFDKMEQVARLIFSTAWEVANSDNRPLVDKKAGK